MANNQSSKSKFRFGLSSFDLAGRKFSFEFPTVSRKLKTRVGSFLTLVIGLIACLATLLIGSKYFDTSSPSVTFSTEKGPEIIHNLLKELIVPPLSVYQEGAPIQADIRKFATIKAFSGTFIFDPTLKAFRPTFLRELEFVDCKELNDPYFNQLLEKIEDRNNFKNVLKCPDFKGNYSLAEALFDSENLVYRFVLLKIYPCSLDDASQCTAPSDISKLRLVVAKTKKTIDPSNYTHPYKITVTTEEVPFSPSRFKLRKYQSKVTKITDLRNDMFGPEEKGRFVSSHLFLQDTGPRMASVTSCNQQSIGFFGRCPEYMTFQLEGGSEVIQVKRQYHLPTEIIGEIGGVLKVALMFLVVYTAYNQAKKKSFIIERAFSQKKDTANDQPKEKTGQGEPRQPQARIKFLRKSQSGTRSGQRQHSKRVKEGCFKSATDVTSLMKNLNFLGVLENLTLNEFSKKLLPQAILIKRIMSRSSMFGNYNHEPRRREGKNKSENKLPEKFDENRTEKATELESQEDGLKVLKPTINRSDIHEQAQEAREWLKVFLTNQVNMRPVEGGERCKSQTKNRSISQGAKSEAEVIYKAPELKRLENPENGTAQTPNSLQKNIEEASNTFSLSQSPKKTPMGQRSRRRNFGRKPSSGSRIFFKSRFSGSKFRKKSSSSKQK